MRKKRFPIPGDPFDFLREMKLRRRVTIDGMKPNDQRDEAFRRIILSIPAGKVSTYGRVAVAAGHPLYHRAVARLLRCDPVDSLPWHRVVGAGGAIKLKFSSAIEQRNRLRLEGVKFKAKFVDMNSCEHHFCVWEID
jgi:methylated-DNA-protein-cysteine methyltransferase related protein